MDLSRLNELRADMEKCFRCSLCKMVPLPTVTSPEFTDACPAARLYHFHGFSGSGKQIMALSLLDGRIELDEAMARITFACTACGYCDVACKFIMDAERHKVNMRLREALVDAGLAPEPLKEMAARLKETGRPVTGATPGAWAEGLGLKVVEPGGAGRVEVLLVAGCAAANDENAAATARKLARLFKKAGVTVGILGDAEPCCGIPAYWAGYRDLFAEMADKNASILDRTPADKVVVACGSCLGAIRGKYPEYARATGANVISAMEGLAMSIESGRLKLDKPINAKVTYHDPCYLGRQSAPFPEAEGEEKIALGVMTYTDPPKKINYGTEGVYDEPRAILGAIPGLDFIEMQRVREHSFCCGGGGGAPLSYPELAASAAGHRIEEARSTGAKVLATACHHCRAQFDQALREEKSDAPMRAVDVVDLVCEAAGIEE